MPVHAHLTAEARTIAEPDDARRIAHLAEDHWIDYPRARQALQELERLLSCPERTQMPGLLLHGESNIGKSMVIQKFLRAHPAREFNTDTGLLQVDVLVIDVRSAPQERRLFGQLLMALNAPYRPGDRLAAVEYTALMLLRKVAPRMTVVDEVQPACRFRARATCSAEPAEILVQPTQVRDRRARHARRVGSYADGRPDRQPLAGLRAAAVAGEGGFSGFPGWVRSAVAAAPGVSDLCQQGQGQRDHERNQRDHRAHQ